jgi:hypothetical protein
VQTDKTNPEVLKIKDRLFISIKYKSETIVRAVNELRTETIVILTFHYRIN